MKNAANPRLLVACALVLALLSGCRQEETRRMPQSQADSRIRAVQQAEMQRAAQQRQAPQDQPPPSQAAPSGGAQPATSPAQAPAPAQAASPPAAQSPQPYLPPSEQGAYVEMTETPAGSPPPPPGSAAPRPAAQSAGTAGAPAGSRTGGGGTMPEGTPSPAAAAGAPPAASVGQMQPGGSPPPLGQTAVAPAAPGADRLTTIKSELDRKLQEFDALMKRAQLEAEKERAAGGGAAGERRQGGESALESPPDDGFGADDSTERASGSGASPDLSGETSPSGVRRGPSAVRGPAPVDDEDVVARQLREAAERESDPVLREKLWDEYRKYKAQ